MIEPENDYILFSKLCKKHQIKGYLSRQPESLLFSILVKLENKEALNKADENWLKEKNLNLTLNTEKGFSLAESEEMLSKASMEITDEVYALYNKLGIPSRRENFTELKLLEILKKFDAGGLLLSDEEKWLIDSHFPEVLGQYYQNRFLVVHNLWLAIRSGKYFRQANEPQRALNVTENIASGDKKTQAALLTNRGGAYRDLGELGKAMHHAEKAIEVQPNSYFAYNLLGAIYYQQGYPEAGELEFQKAIELGSSRKTQEGMIGAALQDASSAARDAIAFYLLGKDPIKYGWVSKFVVQKTD